MGKPEEGKKEIIIAIKLLSLGVSVNTHGFSTGASPVSQALFTAHFLGILQSRREAEIEKKATERGRDSEKEGTECCLNPSLPNSLVQKIKK